MMKKAIRVLFLLLAFGVRTYAEQATLEATPNDTVGVEPFSQIEAIDALVFDQGPTTGSNAGCWSNYTASQNFAEHATLAATTNITSIRIFTCIGPQSGTVTIKILDDAGGVPGNYLIYESVFPTEWVSEPTGGYRVTADLSSPFTAQAGQTYWYGLSGDGFEMGQYSVQTPDNGQMAQFSGSSYGSMTSVGDQMFQLFGDEGGGGGGLCGGPDGFGYTCVTSAYPSGPSYNFETLPSPTTVSLGDDQVSGAISFGFNFNYYGTDYSSFYISSNGFLTLLSGQSNGCCSGQPLPSTGSPNGTIAGWWEDLNPNYGGTIRYQLLGTYPYRRMLVEFNDIQHYGTGNAVTMQYKLYETTNNIEVHYAAAPSDGGNHSAGIENASGTIGLQYQYGTSNISAPVAVRYVYPKGPYIFYDTFEDGLSKWTPGGLWNLETQSETCGASKAPFPTPNQAAYYGQNNICNFDVGTTSGSLTLNNDVPIPPWATNVTLLFDSYEQSECGGDCFYDNRYVEISTNGGGSYTLLGEGNQEGVWYTRSFNLNSYIGQSIRLQFRFDSLDSIANNYFGWLVDNVRITYTSNGCTNVGYYDMGVGSGNANQVAPINTARMTAIQLNDLTSTDLQNIDILFVQNPDNGAYGAEYVSRLDSVADAVYAGMSLIIHDRYVDGAESILPGGSGFNILRDFADGSNIDIRDYTTYVTDGPGGVLDNGSLDGGSSSSHGFTAAASLPQSARLILTRGNPDEIVTFSYQYGLGKVIYSSIPLDYYLNGSPPIAFSTIYAPNVLAHACELGVVPVTVSAFAGERVGDQVRFTWQTATETGNAGFNLYVVTDNGLQRLNEQIIPSATIDSTRPQAYSYAASGVSGDTFYVEDVDVRGDTRLHGPFKLGQPAGRELKPEAIDWDAIRAEHDAQAAARRQDILPQTQAEFTDARHNTPGLALNPGGGIQVQVHADGLYRITYQDLLNLGIDLAGLPVRRLSLFDQGQPVPIYAQPRGVVGPNTVIEFYGRALDTLYTHTNVYTLNAAMANTWVSFDNNPIPNGTPPAFYMDTVTTGAENAYSFLAQNGDPWYDTALLAYGAPFSQDYTLPVDHLVDGAAAATLTVDVWGLNEWDESPDHHIQVAVNGVPVADEFFDGVVGHPITVVLPPGLLQEGDNVVTLTLPGDLGTMFDMVILDHISLTYPRAFVVRDGALTFEAAGEVLQVTGLPAGAGAAIYRLSGGNVTRITQAQIAGNGDGTYRLTFRGLPWRATYVISSHPAVATPTLALGQPYHDITGGSADYLMIAHPHFIAGLAPLVQYHESQGMAVKVVDVNDVYAQFGDNEFDPYAIQRYIRYAAENMGIQYVLLVGGDTYDYLDYLGIGSMSFIPSLYAATGPYATFAPVDALYVDVDGDRLPDLPLGRLPVRTGAELDNIVSKTLAYVNKDYGFTGVFAADEVDAGISFTDSSDYLISQLAPGWNITTAYMDTLGLSDARALLLDSINNGVALTSYFGHSGPDSWTFAGLFNASDAANLTNADRPTIVTQYGCWNTYFVEPAADTLSHAFMLHNGGGAAAVLGASTITESTSDQALGERLIPRLSQPGMTIGQAIQEAKSDLAQTNPDLTDVLLGWTLLGDPALMVAP